MDLYAGMEHLAGIKERLFTPFKNGRVSIINQKILKRCWFKRDSRVRMYRCVSFDTQTVSYVEQYFKNGTVPYEGFDDVIHLLKSYGFGIDYFPYSRENLMFECSQEESVEQTLFAYEMLCGENSGNAIISRYPIRSAETILIPNPEIKKYDGYYENRCLLKATIDVGDILNVLVSHFGLNLDEHENTVETVISNLPKERCVLMGDFNMEPNNPILNPIRQKLYDTAQNFSVPKLSFPSDSPSVKIDYIFVSRDLNVQCADIPEIISSDHRPHIATIEWEP